MTESKLIFVISLPRSGSTLLQAVLSNHKCIDTSSEHWLQLPFMSLFKPDLINAKFDFKLSLDALFSNLERHSNKNEFCSNLKDFLLKQYERTQTKPENLVIDKTPRYYEILDELLSFYPKSKFIILKRHPVIVFKSIMDTWQRYDVNSISQHHCRDLLKAPFLINDFSQAYSDKSNIYSVTYEDIIAKPSIEIAKILNWLDLDFSPENLNYENNKSFHGKYGDPKGILENTTINQKNKEIDWESIRNHTRFDLLAGYGHFLGEDFFKCFGGYEYLDEFHATRSFKKLRNSCEPQNGKLNRLTHKALRIWRGH